MGSFPNLYSDYQFSPHEFSEITSVLAQTQTHAATGSFPITNTSSTAIAGATGTIPGGHQDHNLSILYDRDKNVSVDDAFPGAISEIVPLVPATNALAERSGITTTSMDYKIGSGGGIAEIENFGGKLQVPNVCEFGKNFCGFLPNSTAYCPASEERSGLAHHQMAATQNINTMRVGRYTVQERKDRILRYLNKRDKRNFNKSIKYACRKTIADQRVRVRGRFAKKKKTFNEETSVKNINSHDQDILQE